MTPILNIGRRFWRFYSRFPLKRRMMLTLSVILIVPFLAFCIYLTSISGGVIRDEVMGAVQQSLSNTAYTIEWRFSELRLALDTITSQSRVKRLLDKFSVAHPAPSLKEQIEYNREIEEFLATIMHVNRLSGIRIYLGSQPLLSHQRYYFYSLDEVREEEWARRILETRDNMLVYSHDFTRLSYTAAEPRALISAGRPYRGAAAYEANVMIIMDIDASEIDALLNSSFLPSRSVVALVDPEGAIVNMAGEEAGPMSEVAAQLGGEGWQEIDGNWLSYSLPLSGAPGWRLIALLDRGELLRPVSNLRQTMILVTLLIMALVYPFTLISTRLNVGRIESIAREMQRVMEGDLSVRLEISGEHEIGMLERAFNYLVQSVEGLVERAKRDREELANNELRLLQSQIQPHFLYNTLDLIRWRALDYGDAESAHIVEALAQFYRIGLSYGREYIPLSDDFEHARLYMEIQKYRQNVDLRWVIDLPGALSDVLVPGNLLQPLVENAILHGLLEKTPPVGTVRISAAQEAGDLVIRVVDDGVGMKPEAGTPLDYPSLAKSGYGAWNVHRRLQLAFGPGYGLAYSAPPEGGTEAILRLPIRRMEG